MKKTNIDELFKKVLIKVFRFTKEEATDYINDNNKWMDENIMILPNDWQISYEDNAFKLWDTVASNEQFAELLSGEFSIDVNINKVAKSMIEKLKERIASEINNKTSFEVVLDNEYVIVERKIKSIGKIEGIIKVEVPIVEKIKEKLDTYKCFYEYLTPGEMQRLLLSKVTYVAPVQIKKIGGSYGVIIPIDVLKMFIDEENLKKGTEISAKLKANADNGEIILCEFK